MAGVPKQPVTQDDIAHFAAELKELTSQYNDILREMTAKDIPEVLVLNRSRADAGISGLHKLADKCDEEVKETLRLRRRAAPTATPKNNLEKPSKRK